MNNKLWDIELKAMARSWRDLFDIKGKGNQLVVTSNAVVKPLHVRYGYECIFPPPFLFNAAGLPAATFTTLEK